MEQDINMLEKWARWYTNLESPQAYGDVTTYYVGESFLNGLDVEDWGCGKGFFRTVHNGEYLGVDGTSTPFTDIAADLTQYTSKTSGIFMRHVIEHNLDWQDVLDNAVKSFTNTLVLILFTPMVEETKQIAWNKGVEVPDMAFSHLDIVDRLVDCSFKCKDFTTATQYGTERVYVIKK